MTINQPAAPPPKLPEPSGSSSFTISRRVALWVCSASALVALVSYASAMTLSVPVGNAELASHVLKGQLSSLGGVMAGILITMRVKDARATVLIASLCLIFGAVAPWLHQIIPSDARFFYQLASPFREFIGPALFNFGIAFLVKAIDTSSKGPKRGLET